MSRALAAIDERLNNCRLGLKRAQQDAERARIRVIIDDLLDERNVLHPPIRRETGKACGGCYQPAPITWHGNIAVIDCPRCDRRKCKCGKLVPDRSSTKCPDGHWLDR